MNEIVKVDFKNPLNGDKITIGHKPNISLPIKEVLERLKTYSENNGVIIYDFLIALVLLINNNGLGNIQIGQRTPFTEGEEVKFLFKDEVGETWDINGEKAIERFNSSKEDSGLNDSRVEWITVDFRLMSILYWKKSLQTSKLLEYIYKDIKV